MKTTLHTYSFNTNRPEDCEPYYQLKTKLEHTPGRGHKMHALKMPGSSEPKAGEIILEPEHLFENQWNSNVGRVFDWYEEAHFNNGRELANIKIGHYLDITPEMVAIRQNTLKCGYTGQQFPADISPRFNTTLQALASPYLKESELHLLRLLPVCDEFRGERKPLNDIERAFLLPKYIEAQTKKSEEARASQREEVLKDFEKADKLARMERDGFIWCLDRGIQIENCIFYNHTETFCFGWRQAYTGESRLKLLELLKPFPFQYDVKC